MLGQKKLQNIIMSQKQLLDDGTIVEKLTYPYDYFMSLISNYKQKLDNKNITEIETIEQFDKIFTNKNLYIEL